MKKVPTDNHNQKKLKKNLEKAKKWQFCDNIFYEGEEGLKDKFWNHSHITRKYRESAYDNFDTNKNQKSSSFIPTFMHFITQYD